MAEETNETAAPAEAPVEAAIDSAPADSAEAPAAAALPPIAADAPPPQYQPYQRPAYGSEGGRRPPMGGKRFPRRKVCVFCVDKIDYVDYKDMKRLRKFVTERGKILPRRISGNCASHQRMLTVAIKRARVIALLPFKGE